jgi:hypothetical protein
VALRSKTHINKSKLLTAAAIVTLDSPEPPWLQIPLSASAAFANPPPLSRDGCAAMREPQPLLAPPDYSGVMLSRLLAVPRKTLAAVLDRFHRDLGAFPPDDLQFFVFKLVSCVEKLLKLLLNRL